MGIDVELVEGVGPVVAEPVATRRRRRAAAACPTREEAFYARCSRRCAIVRRELEPDRALVGFCGGPFTVAGYLVEGKPSRDFVQSEGADVPRAGGLARADGQAGRRVRRVRRSHRSAAGADAIQLFDSWVGVLSVSDYEEFVAPYSARMLESVRAPTIHFGTGTAHLLGAMAAAGGDCIGLDWRLPLDEGWARGRARSGRCRGTSTRLFCSARGRGSRPPLGTSSPAPAAEPATSSTSATVCFRRPIRTT